MTGQDVMDSFVLAAGRGVPIPARLAQELLGGRFPTRGRSRVGTVVLVDAAVFLVAEGPSGWVLYRLPMPAWWAMLPGHRHGFVRIAVRGGDVALCVFCGLLLDAERAPS